MSDEQRAPNWAVIRQEYEDGASLRALAAKHGISKSVIGDRKYREKWDQPDRTSERTAASNQNVPNRDANASVRVAQAISYRQAGWTYERIAAQCGYSSASVCRKAIQRELDRVITQNITAWRNDHLARLEKLHEEAWTIAMDKKAKGRLFAFDRILQIEERQAKLLGLDAKSDDIPDGLTVIRQYNVEVGQV